MDERVKQGCKCEFLCLEKKFYKNRNKTDGVYALCKICMKDVRTHMSKTALKTDDSFRLIVNTRSITYKPLKGMMKQPTTKESLAIVIDTYRNWIEYQFTQEMNWSNIDIDHVKSISSFDVTYDEEFKEAFIWINTQPLLKEIHSRKGTKPSFLEGRLQIIKSYHFLKLHEEWSN